MPLAQVNSTVIYYQSIGDGYPVLFLHGMATGHRFWEPQEDHFSAKYEMIMPDLRGHGQSGRFIFSGFNLELMADDMKHLLDELQVKKAHIVGVSMGAMIGLIFSIKYPNYVNRLAVSDGYCDFPNKTAKVAVKVTRSLLKLMPWSTIRKIILSMYETEKQGHTFTKKMLERSFTVNKQQFVNMKMSALPHMTGELKRIVAPTLIIGGDAIEFEKIGADMLYHHIPDARLAIFKDAFDPISMMRRDIFNEMVTDFLENRPIKTYDGVSFTS